MSLLVILPKSPWEQSLAETEKDGVPTEDKVADIFDAIIPLFPTPQTITFDLHFDNNLTAWLNDMFIEFFSFFKALICRGGDGSEPGDGVSVRYLSVL